MPKTVDATRLKAMLNDGDELALLDVREEGQFGVAHMLYAIPLPYSVLEMRLRILVPRRSTRTVLVDSGDVGAVQRRAWRRSVTMTSPFSKVAWMLGVRPATGFHGRQRAVQGVR